MDLCPYPALTDEIAKTATSSKLRLRSAKIEIIGIGVGPDVAPMLDNEKALCLRHIQRTQDERVQYAEDDCVGADGQRQRQNGSDGEAGRLAQLAQGESHIGPNRIQRRRLPNLAAALFQYSAISKSHARPPLRFLHARSFAHQLLRAFFNVEADFLAEIVIRLAAAEDVRYPVHRGLHLADLSICCGLVGIQDQCNAFKHSFET